MVVTGRGHGAATGSAELSHDTWPAPACRKWDSPVHEQYKSRTHLTSGAIRFGDVLITSRQLCSLCVGVRNLQGLGGRYGLLIYRREKANEPATHWW